MDRIKGKLISVLFASLYAWNANCTAQNLLIGSSPKFMLNGDTPELSCEVGIDYKANNFLSVGVETFCSMGQHTRVGLLPYYSFNIFSGKFAIDWKLSGGLGHAFFKEAGDHSYVIYGSGIKFYNTNSANSFFIEPSIYFRSYSAFLSPSADRGWIWIKMGVSIAL